MTDFTGKSAAEILDIIAAAQTALYAAQQAEATTDADRRLRVGAAIAGLESLLGAVGAPAGVESIRAIREFDDVDVAEGRPRGHTLGENAGLALSLAFEGLEILSALVRDIAKVTAGGD